MKKFLSFVCLTLVISMAFLSCEKETTYEDEPLSLSTWPDDFMAECVGLSVAIPTAEKMPLDTKYDLTVGLGLINGYGFKKAPGFFRIRAKGFRIIDKDENEYRDEYIFSCDDFCDEPYVLGNRELSHSEDFSLQFVGDNDAEYVRTTKRGTKYLLLSFYMVATIQMHEECEEDLLSTDSIPLYAILDGDTIRLSFLDPAVYESLYSSPEPLKPVPSE